MVARGEGAHELPNSREREVFQTGNENDFQVQRHQRHSPSAPSAPGPGKGTPGTARQPEGRIRRGTEREREEAPAAEVQAQRESRGSQLSKPAVSRAPRTCGAHSPLLLVK